MKTKKIIVYSQNGCSHCEHAKDYFIENNLEFTEKNMTENEAFRAELIGMGIMQTPLIIIDDVNILGFKIEQIEKELAK